MGLSSLTFPSVTIKTSGGEFSVRGLNSADISKLLEVHREEIESAFTGLVDKKTDGGSLESIGLDIVRSAPTVMASVIALAADDYTEEGRANAKRLSAPAQLEALNAIGRLTFDTEGGVKKVLALVLDMMQGTRETIADLRA